mmetsp:Transcript_4614/g.9809  ORF Transcript_4614/g.9809 Transcript_4614/m.9809 type:complete len:429 (+) Transcript_4614:96-1382(+)
MKFSSLLLFATVLLLPAAVLSTNAAEESSEVPPTRQLLPNGSECSESSQCDSGCCVWNPFANEVCDDDAWYRDCMEEDYTFVYADLTSNTGSTCASTTGTAADTTVTDETSVLIMTYNLYLILLASDGPASLDDRADRIAAWFAQSPEGGTYDVVAFQETWVAPDTIRDGMIAAGYCHYVYDDRGTLGSGLALYSKHPIERHDFRGYQNACASVDCAVDKGVSYVRINKDGTMINVFNTHAMFSVDNHDVRKRQYDVMRTYIDEQNIQDELVLMVGDFNEDKINTPALYDTMLSDLAAQDFVLDQDSITVYSYDPVTNDLIDPESAGAGSVQQALDHILYDDSDGAIAPGSGSTCEYLTPKDSDGKDLSDHFPMSCDVMFGENLVVAASSDSSGSSQSLLGSNSSLWLLSRVALAAALGAALTAFEYS